MSRRKLNDTWITVRLPRSVKKEFNKKAEQYGTSMAVARELITAFTEDRVTVTPPETIKESLYVSRSED